MLRHVTTPTTPAQPIAERDTDDTASGPAAGLMAGGGMPADHRRPGSSPDPPKPARPHASRNEPTRD